MKGLLKWLVWILPIGYMILIWVLSSMPANAVVELPDTRIDRFIKESLHLVEFAILYLLLVMALRTSGRLTRATSIICAVFAISYGLLDEIHQSFVPYRSATIIDFVKDTIGVLIAYYFTKPKRVPPKRVPGTTVQLKSPKFADFTITGVAQYLIKWVVPGTTVCLKLRFLPF